MENAQRSARRASSVEDIRGTVDFAIITIKQEEFTAVLSQFGLKKPKIVKGARDYAIKSIRRRSGGSAIVAITRCISQGNNAAQDATRDIIKDLDPRWILVVGIAGARPASEIGLGDVVVGTNVLDFSVEAVKNGAAEYSVEGRPVDHEVENFVTGLAAHAHGLRGWQNLSTTPFAKQRRRLKRPDINLSPDRFYGPGEWQKEARESLEKHIRRQPQVPKVYPAVIAASDRLIKSTDIIDVWSKVARHVRVVEMESAGVYIAARGRGPHRTGHPTMSIRGISDIIGFCRTDEWTEYACCAAAAFAYAFVRLGYVRPPPQVADLCVARSPTHPPEANPTRGKVIAGPWQTNEEKQRAASGAPPAYRSRPRTEVIAVLTLEGDLANLHELEEWRILMELRERAKDVSIQIISKEQGSVRLTLSMSPSTARTLLGQWKQRELARLNERKVLKFQVESDFEEEEAWAASTGVVDGGMRIAVGDNVTWLVETVGAAVASSAKDPEPTAATRVRSTVDEEIAHAIATGDRNKAFSLMVREYSSKIFKRCLMITRDRTQAEDAMQQTFISAARSFDSEKALPRLIGAWLNTVATNQSIDQVRMAKRRIPLAEDLHLERMEHPTTEPVENIHEAAALELCLAKLGPRTTAAILLRYQDGMTWEVIANTLGEKEDPLRIGVQRALATLRECLDKNTRR